MNSFCVEYVTATGQHRRVRYQLCLDPVEGVDSEAYWRIIEADGPEGWRFVGRQRVTDLQWYLTTEGR